MNALLARITIFPTELWIKLTSHVNVTLGSIRIQVIICVNLAIIPAKIAQDRKLIIAYYVPTTQLHSDRKLVFYACATTDSSIMELIKHAHHVISLAQPVLDKQITVFLVR